MGFGGGQSIKGTGTRKSVGQIQAATCLWPMDALTEWQC